MKRKNVVLLFIPFILSGCNSNNYDMPKSPFSDSYSPIGMKSEYSSTISSLGEDYNKVKSGIKNYIDNDEDHSIWPYSYSKIEETRDLKAAYFGKNIGAANLCSLKSEKTYNTRYKNNVTTKFVNSHVENQLISGSIDKKDTVTNEFTFETCLDDPPAPSTSQLYISRRYTKTNSEPEIITDFDEGTFNRSTQEPSEMDPIFGLNPYLKDIKSNFNSIEVRGTQVEFSVLADNNNAVYGKITIDNKERVIIKEAKSVFVPYSTTVGDTYKAVDNFFYEALLENNNGNYKFTNFRFYHEMLILSEAYDNEEKIPVVFLDKPQLVEYSEIKYTINYSQEAKPYNKSSIPGWKDPE